MKTLYKRFNWIIFWVIACTAFLGAASNENIHTIKDYLCLSIGGTLILGGALGFITMTPKCDIDR